MSVEPPMRLEWNRTEYEILDCPGCGHMDLDFELLAHKLVKCFICGAVVQVTGYKVTLDTPDVGTDIIEYLGTVVTEGAKTEADREKQRRSR